MPFRTLYLLLLVLSSLTALSQPKGDKSAQRIKPEVVVGSLVNRLETYYILPATSKAMSTLLETNLKNGNYRTLTDPSLLAARLEADLKTVYPDKHLYISYDPTFKDPSQGTKLKQEKSKEREKELIREKESNFSFTEVKILPRNIGYVRIDGFFTNNVEEAIPTVASAFKFLENTKFLILDLRYNGGGNPEMVRHVASYFFKDSVHLNDIEERFGNKKVSSYTNPSSTRGISLEMPVFVLTGKRTFSGAEALSYSFRQINRAKLIGDTTAGGCHLTREFELKEGFVAEIPFARSVNPYSKTNWEGTGVFPDIYAPTSEALKKAQETIHLEELRKTTDPRERSTIEWQLNSLKASFENQNELEALKPLCGDYEGGSKVFLGEGNILYLRNADMDNEVLPLIPITPSHYLWDENIQIEFVTDQPKGPRLKMMFNGGHVREKLKINK
jgi:hypothetical protein